MERSNFWTFLGLGLALGICLEVMKHPAAKTNVRLAGFTRFETLLAEGRQVNIPDEPQHDSKKRARMEEKIVPHQLSADELPPQAETPAVAQTPAPKKVETPEEKKKREEAEKKKKQEEKKKLREKFLKDEAERKAKAAHQTPSDDEKKKEEPAAEENPPMATITTIVMPPGAGTSDDPKTVAEWEAYLMKDPDFSRLDRFVKAYQTGEVSSEIFYTVIGDMLQDHRPEMHTLAVTALGATPSQMSFDMLINTSVNDPYSSARSQAMSSLDSYARLENLRFLMSIITSSHNPNAVVRAIRLVQQSAKATLKSRTGGSGGGGPSAQGLRSSGTTLTRYYQPFVAALTNASQSGQQSASVRTAARGALQDVQALLGSLQQQQSPLTGGAQPSASGPAAPATL